MTARLATVAEIRNKFEFIIKLANQRSNRKRIKIIETQHITPTFSHQRQNVD